MTTTSSVSGTSGTTTTDTSSSTASSTSQYSSDMFMKLLVTQLQNQDPSSPMDSSTMITQTSELASMEQLTSLNSTTTSTYSMQMRQTAADLIGKTVTWTDSDGNSQSAAVTGVSFSSTTPTLTVGSTTISLTDVTGVATGSSTSSTSSTTSS